MRIAAILVLLAALAAGQDFALLGIRDNPAQDSQAVPPRVKIAVDIFASDRLLDTRFVTIRDASMRRLLFHDPVIVAVRPDLAYLLCPDGKSMRCLRFSWSTGEDLGKSFLVHCGALEFRSPPIHVLPERVAFLTDKALVNLDLRLGTFVRTKVRGRPLHLQTELNRLYIAQPRVLTFHSLLPNSPPDALPGEPKPLFELPDKVVPARAAVNARGTRIAYASPSPSRRADAARCLFSVADSRGRLLLRRSMKGRFHDLRWLDDNRVLLTTTDVETTFVHVLQIDKDRLQTKRLPARYLAPPEIASAALLGLRTKG